MQLRNPLGTDITVVGSHGEVKQVQICAWTQTTTRLGAGHPKTRQSQDDQYTHFLTPPTAQHLNP
jgi:hypothetical protein